MLRKYNDRKYISLLCEDVIQTLPKVLCRDLINLNGSFLRTKYPTAFHAKAEVGGRDSFGVANFPWSVTKQYSHRLHLLKFVEPFFLELFVANFAVSFALSTAIVRIFFIDRFGWKVTLSGGASGRIFLKYLL